MDGKVILYADVITGSMRRMIDTTERRREKQLAYNAEHNITPRTVESAIQEGLVIERESAEVVQSVIREAGESYDVSETILDLEREMLEAAEALEFERAASLRDQIRELKGAPEGKQHPARGNSQGFHFSARQLAVKRAVTSGKRPSRPRKKS